MSTTGLHSFDRAVQTANIWLIEVEKASDHADRQHAYRILRAWLHTLRDRLPVDVAAKLGAQLPLLLRGVYYEGWDPSDTPVKYDQEAYVNRFSFEASIPEPEVARAARAVTVALRRQLSQGELDEVVTPLPRSLRRLVAPGV